MAAQGLQGLFAAQGLQAVFTAFLRRTLTAQGFLAAQGFFAAQGFLAAHGLAAQLAMTGIGATTAAVEIMPTPIMMGSTVEERSRFLSDFMCLFPLIELDRKTYVVGSRETYAVLTALPIHNQSSVREGNFTADLPRCSLVRDEKLWDLASR